MGASQVEETSAQAQKLYTCEHCQVTFLRPVHLERHMRNVHSQEQESECKVCHKLFQNKYYLSVHMLTHAMDKELECPLCKKRFPDVDTLNKHKDAHLGISMKKAANVNNRPFTQGTNPQLNNQPGAGNVVHAAVSTAGSTSTTSAYSGAGRGNTFNCDLRRTDLNSLNRNARNYRSGQSAVQNVMRAPSNTNSTVSCDLRLGDINSLNQNATNSIRLPQKRPSNESNDVIVTGISSLKRPFRGQGLSGTNISRNQGSAAYGPSLVSTANKTPVAGLSQPSSRNSFLQNQFRNQNPMAASQHNASNNMTNRNVTDRIYLTSEGVSSQSTVRNSLPARISYNNRKQLANHLTQNNRFGGNSIYSNLSHQRNQLLRNSNQTNQRSVVNCDLTRSNLGTINRRPGLPYRNTSQQFSNGTKELDSTVNCDLTISNISSLNKSQWPTNSNSVSRSAAPLRNYGLSTRPVSTVNFDLTTADINVLKRDRRLQQTGRVLPPSTSTTGQTPNTLNCDLSMVNLSSIEKNRPSLNNGNRFGRLNPNVMSSQNSQMVQNTVNCDLTTNNLNDWNRRNTICYRAQNQQSIPRQNNRQPGRPPNSNLSNVSLSNLNQRAVNNLVAGQSTQQQVRPVQVYANTSHPAVLQRQKIAAALGNRSSNFGVQGSNNALRNRTFPRRMASVGQPASPMGGFNRSRMSRLIRQRKTLASSNIPMIDLDPDEDVSVVSKGTARPTNATNVVQFDLTGPDVNVTTYQNGGSSYPNKQPSGNLVDIVELDTSNNTIASQPASNNANSVVEFDLSNTSIQAFSTGQNETSSTCTINLDTDDWASNSRNITTGNNASSASDITLLEVRNLNKPAKESDQTVPDITLSNVRSLSNLQPTSADDRSAVSGITLVDIRSLSTSEIDANFQDDSENSETKVSSEGVPGNSSSVRRRSSRVRNSKDNDADTMPAPSLILDNDVAVDLCSNDGDNADASVISEDQTGDEVQLKEDYFTCKICLEQIHHLCNYISHLKSHDAKEFCKCYYCDSVFGNIQELVVHSVVHVGDLKKQCVFCREVLATREDPITHMTGCGEFQCIMFESGTRVKIEKSFQKEGDQGEETENVIQNQVDQGEKTESVTHRENASLAQNQVDQTKTTDQADGIKVADQNQVDKVEAKTKVSQCEKGDGVTSEEDMKSSVQNRGDPMDQDINEKNRQTDGVETEKVEGEMMKDNEEESDEETKEAEMADGNASVKTHTQEDPVTKTEFPDEKEAENLVNENFDTGNAEKFDPCLKNSETSDPCFDEAENMDSCVDEAENMDSCVDEAEIMKPRLNDSETPKTRLNNSEIPEPHLNDSETLEPHCNDSEMPELDIDGSKTRELHLDGSETQELHLDGAETQELHLDGAETQEPHHDGAETLEPHHDGAETLEPHVDGAETLEPHVDGAETLEPHVDGAETPEPHLETPEPHLEGAETPEPHLEGAETPEPHLEGAETPEPHLEGAETPEPHLEGAETPEPHLEGAETSEPHLEGAETPEPHLEGAETPEPHIYNFETPEPHLEGSETPEPHLEGSETPEPHLEGSETPEPHLEGSETPEPHLEGSETPEPHLDGSETPEPHLEGSETPEPHLEGSETPEPHLEGSETPEPHLEGSETPEPHLEGSETPEPHLDNSKTPEPHLDNSKTPDEDDWCKWERDMIRNSKLAGNFLTNAKVKIEKELDCECEEEIKFEVNLNKIKTEIDSTQETLEES